MATPERLNRYLARRGVASRRGADALIVAGRVRVNGAAGRLGDLVDADADRVLVDGRAVGAPARLRTILLNKPAGPITTRHDPQGRPTVMDLVDDPDHLFPVGRLDHDSRGLLLLTTDGELAMRLTHPRHGITKTYDVRLSTDVDPGALRQLTIGVELEDGPAAAVAVRRRGRGRVEVVMGEGRRREVRRLLAAVGLQVVDLRRVAMGPLQLGAEPEGTWRELTDAELDALHLAVGLAPCR